MKKLLISLVSVGLLISILSVGVYAATGQSVISLIFVKVNSIVNTIRGENAQDKMIAEEQAKAKEEYSTFVSNYVSDIDGQLRNYNQVKRDDIKKSIQDTVKAKEAELNNIKQDLINDGKKQIDEANNVDKAKVIVDTEKILNDVLNDKLK